MNRALFLDRDGVINEDYGYVHKIEDFHFRDGIFDVCRAAQNARLKIIVVTNQAGIGRGLYSEAQYKTLTTYMLGCFREEGVSISGVYHCPFHPTCGLGHFKKNSFNRKPNPGLIIQACTDFNINPLLSIMVGDSESDKAACFASGIRLFVPAGHPKWTRNAIDLIKSC